VSEFTAADYGDLIAERMRSAHAAIASRWLERLRALLPVESNDIFPSDNLLDHIPGLIRELAEFVRTPETESFAANTAVHAKARELGELRYEQQASVHQLLQEYRLLAAILSSFVKEQVELLGIPPNAPETLTVLTRLHEGVGVLLQITVDTFVAAYAETIARQTARLENFSRMVSHELRQPLGALQYAGHLLQSNRDAADSQRDRCVVVINRNVGRLIDLTGKLETLCRLTDRADDAHRQEVDLSRLVGEVARQLREMADARQVHVRYPENLPAVVLDVARVELILINLVSNAIKYSDPVKSERFVDVSARVTEDGACILQVRDNGLGIDAADLESVFKRFYRAHANRDHELGSTGIGLGLFIAQECVSALRGTIAVRSTPGDGTLFTVTLPAGATTRDVEEISPRL
jgi:signal transduction histidine kinase